VVQETDKIKDHIDAQRGRLERDLHEIEHRVTKAVDWREWFDRNPGTVLGAAAAGGFALSLLLRRSRHGSDVNRYAELDAGTSATGIRRTRSVSRSSSQLNRMADTLDNTVAALVGVASRKIRDFVADAVPNFREEYREVEAGRPGPQSSPAFRGEKGELSAH
jgi:hypothetical protein